MKIQKVGIVVVGSGASGSILAAKLARGGKDVVILEAGPQRGHDDLISSTLWARRLKWGGEPVVETGDHKISHVFNAGFGVGGSAMHHYGVWPRLHPVDFNMQSNYGEGLDWPIGYADLRPYYDEVQKEVGISGDAKSEVWRPAGDDYPMPGVPQFTQGRILAKGFNAKGMNTAPLPLAVNSIPYNGRRACIWDGWCDAGCPIGALANPVATYLPQALSGGARLMSNATVIKVLTSTDGMRCVGVRAVVDGEEMEFEADHVVLAAFAVQNPRLLLASATEKHPHGLGNGSFALGKYIMTHPAGLVYGLFEEETQCYLGAFGGQLVNQDAYDNKSTHASADAFGSYQWMIAQAVKPNDLLGIATTRPDLFGAPLDDFMKRAAKHFASMTAVVEDLPMAQNRVTLSDEKDPHGVPLAQVHHDSHPKTRALWQAVLEEGKSVFEAAGAKEVWTGPQGAMHIMGGTVMGDNPNTSVTDSYGQLHDVKNLYVAGPGLFPTSGGVNPTFTIHALASRTAQHLLERVAA
ncbi:MAG: GMC family oxidoreductase [Pseudomonadota bacterium]